jgi:hypothetical protein
MTNISRGLAALTILVVAGFTAGCGSADDPRTAAAPTKKATAGAPAKKAAAPAKAPPAKAPPAKKAAPAQAPPAKAPPAQAPPAKVAGPASTAYCVPLATAQKVRPPFDDFTDEAQKSYGKLLTPAVALAVAAGRTDVSRFLSLTEKNSLNPSHDATDPQGVAAFAAMKTAQPIILRDCGIDMLK